MIDHENRKLRLIDWGLAEFYHPGQVCSLFHTLHFIHVNGSFIESVPLFNYHCGVKNYKTSQFSDMKWAHLVCVGIQRPSGVSILQRSRAACGLPNVRLFTRHVVPGMHARINDLPKRWEIYATKHFISLLTQLRLTQAFFGPFEKNSSLMKITQNSGKKIKVSAKFEKIITKVD